MKKAILTSVLLLAGCDGIGSSDTEGLGLFAQSFGEIASFAGHTTPVQDAILDTQILLTATSGGDSVGGVDGGGYTGNLPATPTGSGTVRSPDLASCNATQIESQILVIRAEGERAMTGSGVGRQQQISADVMAASIKIYRQAMERCDVDQAAYASAIRQLDAARQQALRNVASL